MSGTVVKRGSAYMAYWYTHEKIDGEYVRKSKSGFKTKREAVKFLNQVSDELENGLSVQGSSVLMKRFLLDWLDEYSKISNMAENIYRGYLNNIQKHIIPVVGDIKLNALEPIHVDKILSVMASNGLSVTSQRYVIAVLRKSLNWAVKRRILNVNVISYIDIPKPVKFKATVLNERQLIVLRNYCVDKPYLLPILLIMSLGLRRGEALGLKWSDFDFDNDIVHIQRTATPDKGGYRFSDCKTDDSNRFLALPDIVVNALLPWKELQEQFRFDDSFNSYGFVFCSETGKIFSCSHLRRQFKKALADCDLPDIRIHDLRHSYSTLLLSKSVDPKITSSILGHSDVRTTLDIYSHASTDMQISAVNVINNVFKE